MLTRTEFEEAVKNMAEDGEVSQVVLAHDAAQRAEIERLMQASCTRLLTREEAEEFELALERLEQDSSVTKTELRLFLQSAMPCGHAVGNLLTCEEPPYGCVVCNTIASQRAEIERLQAELLAWKHSAENADCLKDDIDRLTADLAACQRERDEAVKVARAFDEAGRLLTAQAIDRARGR